MGPEHPRFYGRFAAKGQRHRLPTTLKIIEAAQSAGRQSRGRKRARPPSPTRWRSRRCCTASSGRPRAGQLGGAARSPRSAHLGLNASGLDARFRGESGCAGRCGWPRPFCGGCCGCDCVAAFWAGFFGRRLRLDLGRRDAARWPAAERRPARPALPVHDAAGALEVAASGWRL